MNKIHGHHLFDIPEQISDVFHAAVVCNDGHRLFPLTAPVQLNGATQLLQPGNGRFPALSKVRIGTASWLKQ